MKLTINGKDVEVDVPGDKPLLWVLREDLQLTGTKFGCGKGLCGSCTCHLNGAPIRSCQVPVEAVQGAKVTTIEGLKDSIDVPLQEAWVHAQVPQCGYCQSGQIMAAAALLASKPNPTDADIDQQMQNICRCGTYQRIRQAIHAAAKAPRQSKKES